jgi:UDPglucose 6-dehydrogenase
MKVCVQGLWHLGCVTSAGLSSVGHDVIGLDKDQNVIKNLLQGKAPLFEPGLDQLLSSGLSHGNLRFSSDSHEALKEAEILWVAFDTPVNEDDIADVNFVINEIKSSLPELKNDAVVLISSQMPVGSVRALEAFAKEYLPNKSINFAYSPENLRLGKALDVFLNPDRIIIGTRNIADVKKRILDLIKPISEKIEWMSVESAEMTKHAINAFLATSVTFANEIASICELVGADAKEVERGLKTEVRIGPKAYLSPGGPFAGGTLARDIEFLIAATKNTQLLTPLLSSVRSSNDEHKKWMRRKLLKCFSSLNGVTIAVWGLTYKPGTDTLRRSLAVELCDWLIAQKAKVVVYDPVVRVFPDRWSGHVVSHANALDAVAGAQALVVGTEWPVFQQEAVKLLSVASPNLVLIDANRHLQSVVAPLGLTYIAVGTPSVSEG